MNKKKINSLARLTRTIRRDIITMGFKAQSGHLGCSLGIVDILAVLYFSILSINPKNPLWKKRDIFILSKGHACAALYATLANRGFFPKKLLTTYMKDGSYLAGHVTYNLSLGIEATTGSLGHGLSMGIGMALASSHQYIANRIFVLVGDGECEEGSIWEAIMFAGQHHIYNLTLIIDANNLQILDKGNNILHPFPIKEKLESFGWTVLTVNGNNLDDLQNTLNKTDKTRPMAIIAKTIKGKGVSFMENKLEWHGQTLSLQQYQEAMKEI